MKTNFAKIFSRAPTEIPPFKHAHYLNLLSPPELSPLLGFMEQNLLLDDLINIEGKKILLLGNSQANYLTEKIMEKKPAWLALYLPDSRIPLPCQEPNFIGIRGNLKPLALASGSFDAIIAPWAAFSQNDPLPLLPEFCRVLAAGGKLLLTVAHPTLEILLNNQNPESQGISKNNMESYFSSLRTQNLYLEWIRESLVDKQVRSFFISQEGTDYSDEFSGIPLVLLLRSVKYVR